MGRLRLDLPGDVDAFAYPLRVVDLLHHEVGYVCSGDAVAVAGQGLTIDTVGATGARVAEHGRHDHGPVEVAGGEGGVLGDLRGDGPLEEGFVGDVLDDPATPGGLLVERVGQSSGGAQDYDAAGPCLLHGGECLRGVALGDVFPVER